MPSPVKTPPYKGARARSIRVWCSLTPTLGFSSVQFSSVAQLCQTLCNPMDFSTPGHPVHHQLPELTQTHVHAIQPSSSVIPLFSHLQSLPASGSFPMSRFFSSGGWSIGVSTSGSVFPVFNIHLPYYPGFPGGSVVKNPPAKQEMQVQSLG